MVQVIKYSLGAVTWFRLSNIHLELWHGSGDQIFTWSCGMVQVIKYSLGAVAWYR